MKLLNALFFALLLVVSAKLNSQNRFIKYLSSDYSSHARDMITTSDGGFVHVGRYDSITFINNSAFVIKTDVSGNILWTKKFTSGYNCRAYGVCELNDQSIVVCGYQTSTDGNNAGMMVMKFDASGNLIFNQVYNGVFDEQAESVAACSDGGFILSGSSFSFGSGSQIMVVKCDAAGNVQWSNHYGNTSNEFAYNVIQTSDGGYLVTGESDIMGGGTDGYILKLNSSGVLTWAKVIGVSSQISLYQAIQTTDGNYLFCGKKMNGPNPEGLLVKLDVNGNLLWANLNTGTIANEIFEMKELANGKIILGGTCRISSSNQSWLAKCTSNGNYYWQKYINVPGAYSDKITGIHATSSQIYCGAYTQINSKFGFMYSVHDTAGVNCATVAQGISSYTFAPAVNAFGSYASASINTFNGGGFGSGAQSSLFCNGCGLTIQLTANDTTVCVGTAVNISSTVSGPGAPYSYQWSHGGGTGASANYNPSQTTNYNLSVTTSGGCTQVAYRKVYVGPSDSVSSSPTICAGYPATLEVFGGGWAFNWSNGSTVSTATVAPSQTAIYTVAVNGNYGCSHTYSITVNVNACSAAATFCKNISFGQAAWGFDIIPTADGNYFASGYGMGTNVDACLSKIDRDGNVIWTRAFGDPNNGGNAEIVYAVLESSKGYYIGVGATLNSTQTKYDGIFVCYDRVGNLLWRRVIDYFSDSYLHSVIELPDGSFVAGSNNYSTTYPTLVRVDSLGNLKHIRAINHSACTTSSLSIDRIRYSAGVYTIAGQTECSGAGALDFYIMKMDTAGNILWHKTIGTPLNDYLYDFNNTSDGGYVLCGMKEESGINGGNAYIVKLDASANLAWTKVIGQAAINYQDYIYSVVERNGTLIFGGDLYNVSSTFYEPWLMATDLNGNILWSHKTPTTNYLNSMKQICLNPDGSVAATGIYQNNVDNIHKWLMHKYDAGGNSCCTQNATTNVNYTAGTLITSTGLSTSISSAVTSINFLPVTYTGYTNSDCSNATSVNYYPNENHENYFTLYPNPSSTENCIKIKDKQVDIVEVYTLLGNSVPFEQSVEGNETKIVLRNAGVYFIKLIGEGHEEVQKLIVR